MTAPAADPGPAVPREPPSRPGPAVAREPPVRHASLALAGLYAGAAGGAVAALVDFALGLGRVGQFLPGPQGRVTLALFLVGLYGLGGAILGGALGLLGTLLRRGSDLGPLVQTAAARLATRRADDPTAGLAVTAWAITLPIVLGAAALTIFAASLTSIVRFHHPGLIAALIGTAATGIVLGGIVVAFPLQRAFLLVLGLAGQGRAGRALASPAAALAAFALCCGVPLPIIAALTWETTRLLPFRPFVIAFVWLAATVSAFALGRRAVRRGRLGALAGRAVWRGLLAALLVGLLLALALVAGRFERVRKAASSYAAFAGPITVALRRAIDLDRDGYSAVLGGHDCNDLDSDVNPGAFDWPDDGIDQNCDGTDATVRRPRPPPFAAVPASVPQDLNILLVSIDAVRWDHYGAYGYPRATSPAFDALAREGALLNGYAHAPSTRYSMPAILTGRYPSRVAWGTAWWPNVLPENPRLPVVLKQYGYMTGAVFSYRYFEKIRQFDIGFDHYDNSNSRLHHGTYDPATHGSSSREQTDAAVRFLDQFGSRKWFLWVHYYDPHWFYETHPEDPTTRFGRGAAALAARRPGEQVDLYDGEIRFTDNYFARLIAHLKALGLYDRTILVVTGDHGEGFGEHGIDFHGYHLYNPQTKVPFLVRVPGLGAQRPREPVGHIDLHPTLLNLIRAAPEPRFEGRSFVDLLTTGGGPARHIFQEVMYEGPTVRKTVVTADWKLVNNAVPDQTFELYRVSTDPYETRDLWGATDTAAIGAELRRELSAWMEEEDVPPDWHARVDPAVRHPGQPRFVAPQPLDVRFGDALRLYGYDLKSATVRRGEALDVTWYLEARARLKGPWRLFVHLVGPGFINADHDPVEGLLPLRHFARGMTVADHQKIALPWHLRPGTYTVYLGVFAGRDRLPVSGAGADPRQQRAAALTFTIVP